MSEKQIFSIVNSQKLTKIVEYKKITNTSAQLLKDTSKSQHYKKSATKIDICSKIRKINRTEKNKKKVKIFRQKNVSQDNS